MVGKIKQMRKVDKMSIFTIWYTICEKSKEALQIMRLRTNFNDMVVKDPVYYDANAIHALDGLKSDLIEREDYCCSHFSLTEDQLDVLNEEPGIFILKYF